jgi:hypothetical protein
VRDGKIFGSPVKAPHLDANCHSTCKGMAAGVSGQESCRPGHFGSTLLDAVDLGKLPTLCKGMAEQLRDKKFSVVISHSRKDPSNKYGNGDTVSGRQRASIFSSCAADGRSRRFATECDKLRRCDDLRQSTANHGLRRQRERSPTPQMRQLRWVVEHKRNVRRLVCFSGASAGRYGF